MSMDTSRGLTLFPEYGSLLNMVRAEVEGLTDEHLDWESDRWEWSKWSIRRQVSHMASLVYRWLLERWGDQLFPDGPGISDKEYATLSSSLHDRRLDERVYREMADIERALESALKLAQDVLRSQTVQSMRALAIRRDFPDHWDVFRKAHPTGVEPTGDGRIWSMTLEATFRHMWFEYVTHIYNIQRLKRAQGLSAIVKVPEVGYWVLPEWDRSEPPAAAQQE